MRLKIIVVIFSGIIVLMLCQQFFLIKDRKRQHKMGHDELTGVYNWEHLVQKAELLKKSDKQKCVIYSNISEFKLINELFGRETGNEILKKQADQIRRYATEDCLYGRLGEDHFIMLLNEDQFQEEYLYACSKEMEQILEDSVYNVRIYYGVYRAEHSDESLESMCDKAALAIEAIKGNTQETIAYYDDRMLENALRQKK